jgi:hypothetical protein
MILMEPQQISGRHIMIITPGQTTATESLPWNPHPKFTGVFKKHLVTGSDTGGRMSLAPHHHIIATELGIEKNGMAEVQYDEIEKVVGAVINNGSLPG